MTILEIITEAQNCTLARGDALYYDGDSLILGRDGCQPSYTNCLIVGDWDTDEEEFAVSDMDWINWADVEESLEAYAAVYA